MSARLSRSLTVLAGLVWFMTPACGDSPASGGKSAGAGGHVLASGGGTGAAASVSGGSAAAGRGGNAGMPSSGGLASGGLNSGGSGLSGAAGRAESGAPGAGQGGAAGAGGDEGGNAGVAGGGDSGSSGAGGSGGSGGSCPKASAPATGVELDVPGLSEASGLCASRLSPGVFFTHNDSGTSSDVYAFAADGSLIATLTLNGALSEDWEDIGVGPGPEAGKSYLYVADIGDNDRIRTTSIVVERALEPALSVTGRGLTLPLSFEALYFSYPDGPHNAETLLVDPNSGDLHIATKGDSEGARVYVAHAPHSTAVITPLEYVTTLIFGVAPSSYGSQATGGSVAPDGSALLIRTYDGVFLWRRAPGTSLARALLGEPCPLPVASEAQGEGVSFGSDAWSYYTLGEGNPPELSRVLLSR